MVLFANKLVLSLVVCHLMNFYDFIGIIQDFSINEKRIFFPNTNEVVFQFIKLKHPVLHEWVCDVEKWSVYCELQRIGKIDIKL